MDSHYSVIGAIGYPLYVGGLCESKLPFKLDFSVAEHQTDIPQGTTIARVMIGFHYLVREPPMTF